MSIFVSFLLSHSFSVCRYDKITNSSEFTLFLEVRNREYIDCSQVKGQLTIPANCPIIGDEAFLNCSGLYGNLVFEDRMSRIGSNAFKNTNFLRIIYKGTKEPNCSANAFPDNLPIYVSNAFTSSTLCGYETIVGDLDQLIQESIPEITDLPTPIMTEQPIISSSEDFDQFTTEITIPITEEDETPTQTLTETTVNEPSPIITENPTNICKHPEVSDTHQLNLALSYIDEKEFAFCSQIKGQLELPETLTEIRSSAFYECTGLNDSLKIPKTVETVDDNAFDGCSGLNGYLVIGSEMKKLGNRAFGSTHFSRVFYNGKNEPICGEKPFPDNQIIYTTSEYKSGTFCGYQIEAIEDSSSSFESEIESESSQKVEQSIETENDQNSESFLETQIFYSSDFISPDLTFLFDQTSENGPTDIPLATERVVKKKKLSSGAVVGIIIACVVVVIAVVAVIIYFFSIRRNTPLDEELTSNTLTDVIHGI